MLGTIAITDEGWYQFLARRPDLTEVNFWTPSSRRGFRAPAFSPFIFKLRAPHNAICGFAFFAQYSSLPDWLACDTFGQGNGCGSFLEMEARIRSIRRRIGYDEASGSNQIGCIQLVSPVFLAEEDWIPQPRDWRPRTQSSTRYDLTVGEGRRVWEACLASFSRKRLPSDEDRPVFVESGPRYGEPMLVRPRLGQATFRIAVLEAYGRGCAVTGEHSLPALEASHIRPYTESGPHEVRNGLLLRADLHRLFDRGYLTVTPDYLLQISPRLRADYSNGRSYYPLDGTRIRTPQLAVNRPDQEFLEWHNEAVFRE
jgi:putative restriction endonuclease